NIDVFRSMSVFENVLVGLQRGSEQRARDLLDFVGLTDVADRPVVSLPYAQLKQVEVARALATEPRLLLLDEPASGLSHEEVARLAGFVRSLREELELTVLLVEHHMNFVMNVSQTVHVLDF